MLLNLRRETLGDVDGLGCKVELPEEIDTTVGTVGTVGLERRAVLLDLVAVDDDVEADAIALELLRTTLGSPFVLALDLEDETDCVVEEVEEVVVTAETNGVDVFVRRRVLVDRFDDDETLDEDAPDAGRDVPTVDAGPRTVDAKLDATDDSPADDVCDAGGKNTPLEDTVWVRLVRDRTLEDERETWEGKPA